MTSSMGFTVNVAATPPPSAAVPHKQQQQQQQQHSPWHSPVPYLFGGLAAMLGLIAFALLILACSYWKLSGYLEGGNGGDGDIESGDAKPGDADAIKAPPVFEEKIVVIMAGDQKPTFLATPMSSRASSFGDNNNIEKSVDSMKEEKGGGGGKEEGGGGGSDRSQTNQEHDHREG